MSKTERPENFAGQKRHVAERALAAVKSLTNARTAAVFLPHPSELSLFSSPTGGHASSLSDLSLCAAITVDQPSIDLAAAVWKSHRDSLRQGEMFYSPELNTDR